MTISQTTHAQARAGRSRAFFFCRTRPQPARPSFASLLAPSIRLCVERSTSDKWGRRTLFLPADAEKNGFGWRLSNGNMLEKEARLAGLFIGVDAELDLARTAMRVARGFNSDAKARANKLDVPIFGLAYEFGSNELVNDRGQNYLRRDV